MEYLGHKEISYCTLFNLKLSQDEIEVYESCMRYVKEKCDENEIYKLTGCTIEEFNTWHCELRNLLLKYVSVENLPEKYK